MSENNPTTFKFGGMYWNSSSSEGGRPKISFRRGTLREGVSDKRCVGLAHAASACTAVAVAV